MKKILATACLVVLTSLPALAADDDVIVLSLQVFADGQLVSEPRVAMEPGSEASVMQGMTSDQDRVLQVVFHSIDVHEKGPEMLMDFDLGGEALAHVEAQHVTMPWNEPFEWVSGASEETPAIRILVTPSQARLSDFTSGRAASD